MLADSWKMIRIKDVCELGRGRVINQDELYDHPGQYPVYSSQSKDSGAFGCLDTFDFDGEYVTWTTDGAYAGTVFYRSGRFNCTNVCGTLKAKTNEICMKYLSFGLSTKSKNHVSYVGNPKLMNNIMGNIVIPFPPLPEQRRIAEILDTIDEAIQKTEALISKLKAMKQGLLHDLLTRGLDKNGKLRDTKAHPEQFKDSPMGRIPKEWDTVTIEAIGADKPHAIVDGPFGSNLKSIHYRKKGVPVIQSGFVTTGEFIAHEYVYVDNALFQAQRRSAVVPRDIVMAKIGAQCGTCAILPEGHPVGILAGNSLKISTNPNYCRTLFLLRVLQRYYQIGLMDKLKTETAQPAISLKNLRAMLIPLPSLMEQDSIVSNLNSHDARIHTEEQCCDKLKLQKKGLMHDLLTGKVRISV